MEIIRPVVHFSRPFTRDITPFITRRGIPCIYRPGALRRPLLFLRSVIPPKQGRNSNQNKGQLGSRYIDIYTPGTCLSSILGVEPPKTRPFRTKTRVSWVPGKYISYVHILGMSSDVKLTCFHQSRLFFFKVWESSSSQQKRGLMFLSSK